jgi:type II restriction enzyme
MASHLAVRAIEDAVKHGKAIIKFLSANDVGATRSNQSGFLLPKGAWELYSPHAPKRGENLKSTVSVLWPNGSITQSCVTWYGRAKSEYRLTGGFNSEFPFIDADSVGSLLVLVPVNHANFVAYVLDTDDDIADVQAALGLEVIDVWGVYNPAGAALPETENECIDRQFREFAAKISGWPNTESISGATRSALLQCIRDFIRKTADAKLVDLMEQEFRLFKLVERQLCGPEIQRVFASVDDFVRTASSIMNRRKSRAGWSLENHVAHLLTEAGIPFAPRASEIDGEPDILIPSIEAYNDKRFPVEKLCMVGVKTTCKDRWRQVLKEGKRVPAKHILTMQRGISSKQLLEMKLASVTLIVPEALHKEYPKVPGVKLVKVAEFIDWAGKLVKV